MSTSNNFWNDPISSLFTKKIPAYVAKLNEAGYRTLSDLLTLLPLHQKKITLGSDISKLGIGDYIQDKGKVLNYKCVPLYHAKGKRVFGKSRVTLFKCQATVKSDLSHNEVTLTWYNAYPNIPKILASSDLLCFTGPIREVAGFKQIVNPKIIKDFVFMTEDKAMHLDYPTVNHVPGTSIAELFEKINIHLWDTIPEVIPPTPALKHAPTITRAEAFKILHGKKEGEKKIAEDKIIYDEFISDQLKLKARRSKILKLEAIKIESSLDELKELASLLPYQLTTDQQKTMEHILFDLKQGHPMMRMVQGDVGCGKTSIALLSALLFMKRGLQVALMAPTEALANQHGETFAPFLEKLGLKFHLLLGSTKIKERRIILENLAEGNITLIIGTHSLFQDTLVYKNLGLVIIDEQHKFGVDQRIRLTNKGKNPHSLIMSATPIPRTLSLVQYGDLDISIIKTLPQGRKGVQTRIVQLSHYRQYLSFMMTRLGLGEQAYIVTPAIVDNPEMDLKNVEVVLENYKKAFPMYNVRALHGKMKADEKEEVLTAFSKNEVHLLISTSVIEVGINNPNATIMAIYNPERFGLSSLHQLRGRVGRASKPGFCFLLCDKNISQESLHRIGIIEKTTDGFIIAEKDLEIRGEGELFGQSQSGESGQKKLGSFFHHSHILENVMQDISHWNNEDPVSYQNALHKIAGDDMISKTI